MNSLLQYILVERAKNKLKASPSVKEVSKKKLVNEVRRGQVELAHAIRETIFIALGILSASFGLRGFLLPNNFIDGGATGVSLLLRVFYDIPLGIFLIVVNIPFLFLGAKTIGRKFAVKSIIAIVVLG